MSFLNAYMTRRQLKIWDLFRGGLSQAAIARRLKITRQTTNHAFGQATQKMTRSLLEAAKLHNLKIEVLDPKQGFLSGHNQQMGTTVKILFTLRHGLQAWYHHDTLDCNGCPDYSTCVTTLKEEAIRRGITFTDEELELQPNKLANVIFKRIQEAPNKEK